MRFSGVLGGFANPRTTSLCLSSDGSSREMFRSLPGEELVTDWPDRLASRSHHSRAFLLSSRSCAASDVLAFADV